MPPTLRRKIVVIGDPAVGKSALVHMFASSGTRFPKQYNMTCGVELAHKITLVSPPAAESEANVELYMFDSGGQDIFDEMLPPFWEGALAPPPGSGMRGRYGSAVPG
jgi:GTPase SAR1 family protein